ncbi:MAG: NINE protein [Candidatus Hydrogenedentes bacterium]|nr:NINE protein [Candidatus Hydrogenedentota bacterium]MBI3117691.1 NINE protein [Candidatus Hydrogenedentota bacterium]
MRSVGVGYILWCLCLIGLFGIHRFYVGKYVSGIIWLLTGGLCLIGQLVDLVLIPKYIDQFNAERGVIGES